MPAARDRGQLASIVVVWAAITLVLFAGWLFVQNDYILRLMMLAAVDMIVVIPFGLLMGYMGYLAMGQATFFGIGAYVVGNLTVLRFELDYWPALLASVLITAAVAYLLSFPLFRLRGYHFAIGTLGVGQLAYLVFNSWRWFSGGTFGTSGVPPPAIGEFEISTNSRFYLLASIFLLIAAFLSWCLVRGRVGLALRAIRQDEDLAAARGLDVLHYKRLIFVFAAAFAGLAGGLYAPMQISFDPSSFTVWSSFEYVIYVIIGGAGTLFGPALGVIFVSILQQVIQGFGEWNQIVFGLLVVLVVLFFRGGLWGAVRLLWSAVVAARPSKVKAVATTSPSLVPEHAKEKKENAPTIDPILEVRDVSKRFGGLEAVKDVSFDIPRGGLVGLIGPNGAGKTTMVNLISKHQSLSSGAIRLDGTPIHPLPVFRVARDGISRTYQQNRLFLEDSVIDNIRTGMVWSGGTTRKALSYPGAHGSADERLDALIDFFGLGPHCDATPGNLSHVLRRRAEIAQALALAPTLLLLDEPFAGFSHEEAEELIALLRQCQRGGLTILLIEHNMEVVMQVCEHLYVMHHGSLLASGTPAEIQSNRQVVSVYLGGEL